MTLTVDDKTAEAELYPPSLEEFFKDELRVRVFLDKYSLKDESGKAVEKSPVEMWRRVSHELASVEVSDETRRVWDRNFYWLLEDFRFIPGGRILFGAGQRRRSTLLNCYFIPVKGDSIEEIFDWCKEAARTYSFGGGVGTDISLLRPGGSPVNNAAVVSSGSVSFMELFSVTTGTIGQAGRRGALIITIRVDHPDILEFIDIKRDLRKVNHANISILITDEFMEAVEKDELFELRFLSDKAKVSKKVRAREIWEKLVRNARDTAEPGLIFWDTVKRESPTEYNEMEVHGFNPCSEQCLEDYGCCCLGNVNLSAFVLDEFSEGARINWEGLEKAVRFGVRFLDNTLDYNAERHPLPQEKEASLWSKRIGIGFTGMADMLVKLRMKYDEDETVNFVDKMFERIKNIAYEASSDLAAEKGTFPAFALDKHLAQPFVKRLDPRVLEKIKQQGLRNACILTVPPVGSGSILAGTTSGVEPIFALSYLRRSKSLTQQEFKVFHPLVRSYMRKMGLTRDDELPSFFVTSHKIKPELRVRMQAAMQKHVDSSISSTVNLPTDVTTEEVKKIYFLAWRLGCKGITVYREGSREGILVTEQAAKEKQETRQEAATLQPPLAKAPEPFESPRILKGQTVKLKLSQGSLYVTANTDQTGSVKEVFVTLGKSGGEDLAQAEALGRLISLYLQHGGDLSGVIHTLKGIHGRYSTFDNGLQLLSVPDAVAKALEMLSGVSVQVDRKLSRCPDCGDETLIFESGCYKCTSCGYSKCD